jgi:hypothetical protein
MDALVSVFCPEWDEVNRFRTLDISESVTNRVEVSGMSETNSACVEKMRLTFSGFQLTDDDLTGVPLYASCQRKALLRLAATHLATLHCSRIYAVLLLLVQLPIVKPDSRPTATEFSPVTTRASVSSWVYLGGRPGRTCDTVLEGLLSSLYSSPALLPALWLYNAGSKANVQLTFS